jgi:hypothetical protein
MAAVFHGLGRCFVFVKYRGPEEYRYYYYLGTCVTSPDVEIQKITSPITTDYLGPAPYNRLYHSEIHTVTLTLNALDYTNYVGVKARGTTGSGGILRGDDKHHVGTLMTSEEDFELMLLWDVLSGASDSPSGRRYFSATPVMFRETTENNRILEASISFQCSPIFVKKYEQPLPPATTASTPRRFVGDFPMPSQGTVIDANGISVWIPGVGIVDFSSSVGMNSYLSGLKRSQEEKRRLDKIQLEFEVRMGRRPPPEEPSSSSNSGFWHELAETVTQTFGSKSPIRTDDYLFYLYTEIPSLF